MTSAEKADGQSLAEMVARDLRQQILTGRLAPGRRISQLSIAEQYGVSRLPAREALLTLAAQGLVVIERARSARVAALDEDDMREVYLMREQLEPLAVALAVPAVTESEIIRAEAILDQMERSHADSAEWLRLDRQFHTMWYEFTKMQRLIGTIGQLWDVGERYRALFSMSPDAISMSANEHRLILEAIRRGASEDANVILRMHLRHVRLTLQANAGSGELPRARPAGVAPSDQGQPPRHDLGDQPVR